MERDTTPLSDRAQRGHPDGPAGSDEPTVEAVRPPSGRAWWTPRALHLPGRRHAAPPPRPEPHRAPPPPGYRPAAPPVGYRRPPAPPAASRRDSKRWLLIGGGLAALALLFVVLTLGIGAFGGAELDVNAAQAGVQQVLTDPINGYGQNDVSDVRCNDGRNPVAKQGTGFSCLVRVAGEDKQVAVIFTDNKGTYEVDEPR